MIADCPCDCGLQAELDEQFYRNLCRLEVRLGVPLFATSLGRCEKHNTLVGGSPTSKHKILSISHIVRAADIRDPSGQFTPKEIALEAQKMGCFNGIGIYFNHVHLDCREGQPVRWPLNAWK